MASRSNARAYLLVTEKEEQATTNSREIKLILGNLLLVKITGDLRLTIDHSLLELKLQHFLDESCNSSFVRLKGLQLKIKPSIFRSAGL